MDDRVLLDFQKSSFLLYKNNLRKAIWIFWLDVKAVLFAYKFQENWTSATSTGVALNDLINAKFSVLILHIELRSYRTRLCFHH